MTRIKVGVTAHRRHKHILKLAKGIVERNICCSEKRTKP